MKKYWILIFVAVFLLSCQPANQKQDNSHAFVQIKNGEFVLENTAYRFVGANYWYSANLAASGAAGKERLKRELDHLNKLGINNLRVQICSEGGDEIQYGVKPSLQAKPGEYNETIFQGIDFLLDEMSKRNMKAIFVLNNYWPWSGGMAKYQEWFGAGPIPYPSEEISGSWAEYMRYSAKFYDNEKAVEAFRRHLDVVIQRKNTINGKDYKNDPSIMAWQLANEPRGGKDSLARQSLLKWIKETAAYIKNLDSMHLVSIGSEGKVGHHGLIEDFKTAHAYADIDYLTIHLWPQNWAWYNPQQAEATFDSALINSELYIAEHLKIAQELGKPIVLEEFGLARDSGLFEPQASTLCRDKFYQFVTNYLFDAKSPAKLSGINFWSYAGEAYPPRPGEIWQKGDPLSGDPPHEAQGWYSVYQSDSSTLHILKTAAEKLK